MHFKEARKLKSSTELKYDEAFFLPQEIAYKIDNL